MVYQGEMLMENLIFSLNATAPIFLLMALGLLFKKLNIIDEAFAARLNKFVFLITLPVLVFEDLANVDFREVWDGKFVLFCFAATLLSISLAAAVSLIWRGTSIQGEFIQASYRSSAALLGVALIQNIYGSAGMAPLMIIGSVPLYNIMAVTVLSFIWGIPAGILWSLLRLPMPPILEKTVSNISGMATPLGLIAMGATFDIKKVSGRIAPAVTASFIKLIGLAALFLPAAVFLGFRAEKLVAILVMLGSATTVSCFVMAKNMGHEGTMTSATVMLTTLFAAFTLTGWLCILKSLGLL